MRNDSILKLDSVRVSYGAIEAVKGVSLEVRRGEVVSIIGANGAGKSTVLKSIAGVERVRSGSIEFNGQRIENAPAHQRVKLGIALSPEGRGVFPDQSVRDNLLLGALCRSLSPGDLSARLEREFQRFPRLKERQHQHAGTMSGGEQQMLAISRALMSDPSLLLLDEPSLGLAPLIIEEIFETILKLRETGLSIILVEQMACNALSAADSAYVLETGKVILTGTGKQLLNDPKVRAAYLGG